MIERIEVGKHIEAKTIATSMRDKFSIIIPTTRNITAKNAVTATVVANIFSASVMILNEYSFNF